MLRMGGEDLSVSGVLRMSALLLILLIFLTFLKEMLEKKKRKKEKKERKERKEEANPGFMWLFIGLPLVDTPFRNVRSKGAVVMGIRNIPISPAS